MLEIYDLIKDGQEQKGKARGFLLPISMCVMASFFTIPSLLMGCYTQTISRATDTSAAGNSGERLQIIIFI
jgi:hypothetical protein